MLNPLNPSWSCGPRHPQARSGEIHVWGSSLDRYGERSRRLENLLSQSERERAGRFRFERDARRFVASRATLRLILSRYLDVDPGSLEFTYGPKGKPALSVDGNDGLRFSLSHAGCLLLCAVSRDVELGLDVELIEPTIDVDQIGERIFSASIAATIGLHEGLEKVEVFYSSWVLHEAFVKATGDGLATVTDRSFDERRQNGWFRCRFDVGDYVSAIVAGTEQISVTQFWWL